MFHNITDAFRYYYERSGLTQERFGQLCGGGDVYSVDSRVVRDWLKGERFPNYDNVRNLYCGLKSCLSLSAYDLYRLLVYTERAGLPCTRTSYLAFASALGAKPESAEFEVYSSSSLTSFGGLVAKLLNWRGWTESKLADKLCVSRSTVQRWVNSENIPNAETCKKICALLRVPILLRCLLFEKLCLVYMNDYSRIHKD